MGVAFMYISYLLPIFSNVFSIISCVACVFSVAYICCMQQLLVSCIKLSHYLVLVCVVGLSGSQTDSKHSTIHVFLRLWFAVLCVCVYKGILYFHIFLWHFRTPSVREHSKHLKWLLIFFFFDVSWHICVCVSFYVYGIASSIFLSHFCDNVLRPYFLCSLFLSSSSLHVLCFISAW